MQNENYMYPSDVIRRNRNIYLDRKKVLEEEMDALASQMRELEEATSAEVASLKKEKKDVDAEYWSTYESQRRDLEKEKGALDDKFRERRGELDDANRERQNEIDARVAALGEYAEWRQIRELRNRTKAELDVRILAISLLIIVLL